MTDEKKLDAILEHYEASIPAGSLHLSFYDALEKLLYSALVSDTHDFKRLPIAGIYDNVVCGKIDIALRGLVVQTARGTDMRLAAKALEFVTEGQVRRPNVTQGFGDDSFYWKFARPDIAKDRGKTLRRKIALGRILMFTDINKDWYDNGASLDGLYDAIKRVDAIKHVDAITH